MTRPTPATRAGARPAPTARSARATFAWGERTFVMGILNVTPDSFSGDGAPRPGRAAADPVGGAVEPGAADGRRGRRHPRRRRRVDPARPRAGRRRRGASPGRARSSRAIRAALPGHADQRRHDEARRRRGRPRRRRRPPQRRLGRRRRTTRSPGSPPTRGVPIVVMHNRAEAALHEPRGRGRRRPRRPRSSARSGLGVAWERHHRRPGLRVRQDARAQPRAAPRARRAPRCSAGRSCSGTSRKSTLGTGPRPAGRRAARGDARDDRPRRSPPASTSSASTTSAPNVRAARMSDAIVRGDWRPDAAEGGPTLSDRIVLAQHAASRAATATTTTSCTTPQPFEVDVELVLNLQPAGRRRRPREDGRLREGLRRRPARSSSRRRSACSRRWPRRSATSSWPTSPVTEVGVRVRKPEVELGGPLDHAAVEIWRPRARAG